jgi:UDP-N-acetylglucosamine 2-epimerase (non-hydrolysing)
MIAKKQKSKKVQEYYKRFFKRTYGISFDGKKAILVTAHRRESFGWDFENICLGLKKIAENNDDVLIIYPVHLNPNVQKPVKKILSNHKNISLIKPLDYLTFVWLMNKSYLILTDSGGVQEEAPSLGKPVLVMRKTTERPEGVEAGCAKLVGTDVKKIVDETSQLLTDKVVYDSMAHSKNPYGDGHAAARIVKACVRFLENAQPYREP